MPKMTPEERADLEARLAADEDDDDDEVEVGFADGSYFKGKFRRAAAAAEARGFRLTPAPADDAPKAKSAGKGGNVTQGRFSAGRRVG